MASGSDDYTEFGSVKTERPVPRPDVLDVLVAGGGPGGTAAAMRALELGLAVLVVELDDLMQAIEDFPAGKTVHPDYGVRGADTMPFPPGGELLTALHFEDTTKEAMVARWKRRYRSCDVPARIGSEFTGLERGGDGLWTVKTWNSRAHREITYQARNVIVAVGGGVPRRFDIPGDLSEMQFRLDDPAKYVGGPMLVIGGGVSAAEAVIAISNAKVQAADPTPVYWSYRGHKLKAVESKALSEPFYDAYVGNGNIRYLPNSEPAAVFKGPDELDYLSVRVDRKLIEGRPIEAVHLEFPKPRVVACIGGDLPFQLVESLGAALPLVNDKRYMLINRDGELSLPGVFLIGNARGGRCLRCTDFDDQSTWEWVMSPRNIKVAMWEAALAVETIAVRAGQVAAGIALAAAPAYDRKPLQAAAAPARAPAAAEAAKPAVAAPPASATPAAAPASPPAAVVPPNAADEAAAASAGAEARLESLLPDGSVEAEFPLSKASTSIGRSGADIANPNEVRMADLHATVTRRDGDYVLEDAGSSTGTWLRIQGIEGRHLAHGELVWLGAQILMALKTDGGWAVAHYKGGAHQQTYAVDPPRGLFIGHADGVELDAADRTLSRRHAQFKIDAQGLKVTDLGSTNGTLVRLTAAEVLRDNGEFRIGNKRYRFEHLEAGGKLKPTDVVVEHSAGAAPASAAAGAGLTVSLEHAQFAAAFPTAPGQDLLRAWFDFLKARGDDPDKRHKKPLDWSCLAGTCGLCLVEVLDGAGNFEPVAAGSPELDTLENRCFVDPDPGRFRLTCKAKITGPVKVGMVE